MTKSMKKKTGMKFRMFSMIIAASVLASSINVPVLAQNVQTVQAGEMSVSDNETASTEKAVSWNDKSLIANDEAKVTEEVSETDNKEVMEEVSEAVNETENMEETVAEDSVIEAVSGNTILGNDTGVINTYDVKTDSETGTAVVDSADEFHAALENEKVSVIQVNANLSGLGETTGMLPLVIDRDLTIQGVTGDTTLSIRYLGIVLGADVTFKDIRIEMGTVESNAVVANGYCLTLQNVSIISTSTSASENNRYIPLFCGGIIGYTYGNIPAPGENGTVILEGTCKVGDIYAGSLTHMNTLSSQYNGNAQIMIGNSVTVGNVYGCGGRESMGESAGNLIYSGAEYSVTGNVDVTLYDSLVKKVIGFNGKTAVNYQGSGNLGIPTLKNISSLKVSSGELQPTADSSFDNVSPALSVAAGAMLWIDLFGDMTVGNFSGGGELIIGQEQKLTISGSATGSTKVYIGGTQYTSAGLQSSRKPISEHTYIEAAHAEEENFNFIDWDNTPEINPVFESDGSSGGSWITPKIIIRLNNVAFEEQQYEFDRDSYGYDDIEIPLVTDFTEESIWFASLGTIKLEVTINGKQTEAEEDEYGYINYKADGLEFYIYRDIYTDNPVSGLVITNANQTGLPFPGTYRISFTVPAEYMESQQSLTVEVDLVITGEVEIISIDKPTAQTNLKWNGKEQTGIFKGTGYTLTGDYKATEVGNYTAKAVLDNNYAWTDGSTDELELQWSIDKAEIEIAEVFIEEKNYDGTTEANVTEIIFSGMQNEEQLEQDVDFTANAVFDSAEAGGDKTVSVAVTLKDTEKANHYVLKNPLFELTNQEIREPETNIQFEVQFITYIQETIETQKVDSGQKVTEPEELKRSGYTFDGWYTSDEVFDDTTKWDFENCVVSKNMTLYAKWELKYKVAAPKASLPAGEVEAGTKVYLSSETNGVEIYYTTDDTIGSDISKENGALYTDAIIVEEAVTIYAIASKDGYKNSEVLTVSYTVKPEDWGEIQENDILELKEMGITSPSDVPKGFWIAGVSDCDYMGKAITFPEMRVYSHKRKLTEKVDYTVKYSNNTNAGMAKITITGKGNYSGTYTKEFEILRLDLKNAIIEQSTILVKSNNKVQKKTNKVSYVVGDKTVTLKASKDFIYEYPGTDKNQDDYDKNAFKAAGDYTVKLQGKGNYEGTAQFTQVIVEDEMTLMSSLKYTIKDGKYSEGEAIVPSVLVKHGKDELEGQLATDAEDASQKLMEAQRAEGDERYPFDYIYYCENNREIGTAKITFTGIEKNGFVGTLTKTYKITGNALKSAKVKELYSSYPWTGSTIDPFVNVEGEKAYLLYGTKTLKGISEAAYNSGSLNQEEQRSYDYVYQLSGNTEIGKATLVLTGINEYTGTVTKTFKITGKSISSVKVDGINKEGYEYNGKSWEPAGTVDGTDVPEGFKVYFAQTSKTKEIELAKRNDYKIEYQKNKNKGTATLIITGINGYTGVKKVNFKIYAYKMNQEEDRIQIEFKDSVKTVPYQKNGSAPVVTVKDNETNEILTLNQDYTVKYKNNKEVGNTTKKPTVIITGKGNYAGSKEDHFIIENSCLENVTVKVNHVVYKEKANICKPTITLTDSNGKKLSAGTDYDRKIVYTYAKDVEVTQMINRKPETVSRFEGDEVDIKDIVPIGAEITATVTGIKNYAGTKGDKSEESVVFRYIAGDVSKASVKVENQIYTGKPMEPGKDEITVKIGGTALEKTDYEIVGYSNNVAKGTAKVTIRGIGNYGGEKTVTFKINSKKVN